MALLLAWVNIGAVVLLTFACLVLFLDARGQRVALRAAQETVAALRQRLSAVESASRARPALSPGLPEAPRGSQPTLTTPPASAPASTRRGTAEGTREAVPPPPPVRDGGSAPKPPVRDGSSAPKPPVHDVRATLIGGIAAPSPPAPEGKIAQAPPHGKRRLDSQMERLWHEKTAAALAAGQEARHCRASRCFQEGQALTACECQCDGCALSVGLLVEARAEVLSRSR